jgi:phosphoribosylglycinamide formyltransferase-1
VKLAALASGSGTIFTAMLDGGLAVELLVVDRSCAAVEVAAVRGVECVSLERDSYGAGFDRDRYTKQLTEVLLEHEVGLIAMAGFGTILSQALYDSFAGRVLNTHPSLLPAFPGWHAVEEALAYGVKVTGCTVHIATIEVDSGPILAQTAVPIEPDDTVASLHERIKIVERELYIETIRNILESGEHI